MNLNSIDNKLDNLYKQRWQAFHDRNDLRRIYLTTQIKFWNEMYSKTYLNSQIKL